MKRWVKRVRAASVMGLTWGAGWALAGTLLARVPGFNSDVPFALLFAPLGFISGVIFSGVLIGVERRRGLDRMSLLRFAGLGAASGLLLSGIFVVGAALRGQSVWGEFALFAPLLTPASAICAAGSLWLYRRPVRQALPGTSVDAVVAKTDE